MSEVSTRTAHAYDAPAIVDVCRAAFLSSYPNEAAGFSIEAVRQRDEMMGSTADRIARYQNTINATSQRCQVYVATLGETVVGFTAPMIHSNGQRRLGAMHVPPGMQRRGIGSLLMARALEWHGPDDVYLHVGRHLIGVQTFYEKFGFEKTGLNVVDHIALKAGCPQLDDIEMMRRA